MKIFNIMVAAMLALNISTAKAQEMDNIGKINGNGTKINIIVGDKTIPATLNDTTTAKDLISKLPYTIKLSKYSHDYCGNPTSRLAYDEKDVQFGWKNGEISYEKETPYFVIFFGDEDNSKIHGNQVIIGKVDVDLDTIKALDSVINITIELAGE